MTPDIGRKETSEKNVAEPSRIFSCLNPSLVVINSSRAKTYTRNGVDPETNLITGYVY